MAAECAVNIITKLTGLGDLQEFSKRFTTTETPARAIYHYAVQTLADSEQALELGDVATVDLILIKCIENDIDIDTTYSAPFSAEIVVQEGEVAVFKPEGSTIYWMNSTALETSTIEYLVVGSA